MKNVFIYILSAIAIGIAIGTGVLTYVLWQKIDATIVAAIIGGGGALFTAIIAILTKNMEHNQSIKLKSFEVKQNAYKKVFEDTDKILGIVADNYNPDKKENDKASVIFPPEFFLIAEGKVLEPLKKILDGKADYSDDLNDVRKHYNIILNQLRKDIQIKGNGEDFFPLFENGKRIIEYIEKDEGIGKEQEAEKLKKTIINTAIAEELSQKLKNLTPAPRYHLINTNYSNENQSHPLMLEHSIAAAFNDPWMFSVRHIKKGDGVFLYQSSVGVVGFGYAEEDGKPLTADNSNTDRLEKIATVYGEWNTWASPLRKEGFINLENKPISARKLREWAGYSISLIRTYTSIRKEAGDKIVKELIALK